jgi:hypothetical protein
MCQRVLESEDERFVFRAEANGDSGDCDTEDGMIDSDRDYLQEIDDLLERGGDLENPPLVVRAESPNEYHLCQECRRKFVPDSFDRRKTPLFDFSHR